MKRFAFTLAALQRVKEAAKKQQEAALAEANQKLRALQFHLEGLLAQYAQKSLEFEEQITNGSDSEHLGHYANYFDYLRDLIQKTRQDIRAAEKIRDERQLALVTTMAELKALERLYDVQYQEYLMELQKESDKEMDDFVSYQQTNGGL